MLTAKEVVFVPGASLNALDWMEENMRELEKRDFARTWGSVRQGLLAGVHYSDSVNTIMLGGEVMGLFGVTREDGVSRGNNPWLALTEQATKHPTKIVKLMKEWVHTLLDEYGYLHNMVPVEDETAISLLEVVGFTIEKDTSVERAGADYYGFYALKGDV